MSRFDSISILNSILDSVNIDLIQMLLIFLKLNCEHQFTNCELMKRNKEPHTLAVEVFRLYLFQAHIKQ